MYTYIELRSDSSPKITTEALKSSILFSQPLSFTLPAVAQQIISIWSPLSVTRLPPAPPSLPAVTCSTYNDWAAQHALLMPWPAYHHWLISPATPFHPHLLIWQWLSSSLQISNFVGVSVEGWTELFSYCRKVEQGVRSVAYDWGNFNASAVNFGDKLLHSACSNRGQSGLCYHSFIACRAFENVCP